MTLKACVQCKAPKLATDFAVDRSRVDGRTYVCRACRNARNRAGYTPRPRPSVGRRFVAPRDGDRQQARRRVNHLVATGVLPRPGDVPCLDCGHTGPTSRHEYDHHLGYDAEHHEHVEAVCAPCHHRRERARGQQDEDRME